jgi:hypothetical protein
MVDRRVQVEALQAANERPIFRANRRLDLINFGACSVEGPG